MTPIIVCLLRFAVALFGYVLSCLAASVFLHLLFFGAQDLAGEEAREIAVASSLVSVPVLALVISSSAFIPAAVAIVVAELLSWRDWLTYALAGGGIGLAVGFFGRDAAGTLSGVMADPGEMAALAGAGLFAGIVYWLAAGRSAGRRPAAEKPTSPGP